MKPRRGLVESSEQHRGGQSGGESLHCSAAARRPHGKPDFSSVVGITEVIRLLITPLKSYFFHQFVS